MFFSRIYAMDISRSLLAILGACLIFGHTAKAAEPAPDTANMATPIPRPPDNESALIERGKYVAHLGDCVACHTANKGPCLLYTSDAADDLLCVDLGGRRIIKKKKE